MRLCAKFILAFLLAVVSAFSTVAQSTKKASDAAVPGVSGEGRNAVKNSIPNLTSSSFGFQCGTGKLTNCPGETWPSTIAQPGLLRLWDSQVQWASLNPRPGDYQWATLDGYLDAIAAHQPRDAMYTFGYTPCWDTKGECEKGWGSTYPPSDLGNGGSLSFNNFVTALLNHCSPNHHCVKDSIKYWEMWNEANSDNYWNGSVPELYQLMAPAVALIRSKIPGALILTPPATRADTDWMLSWLNQENKNGRLSDIFSFHLYLQKETPERRFLIVQEVLKTKNATAGWGDTPWMNTETNFDAARFACQYSTEDCLGQMVRWHILHFSFGARNLSWYFFNTTIGRNPEYSNAYHQMMEWLVGGHFTSPCSVEGNIITCPFVQANGHHAIFVWTFGGDNLYTPAIQYADYKDLSGRTTPISQGPQGKSVPIGVKPVMLEASN
jgi:hypothetical protein